ncbi:MAG: 16S rRNA (cytosine(1402)-N(4))-methyltransferase RsmH, partial [Candidatus Omnitrophica bacterium]|nr:16S rRNA (cytosine(1402)-N(4))-methyltransferase RsmH [Candidatus Omnitrophota bacterium]
MPLIKPWKSDMSNENERIHRPVMLQEVLSYLAPQSNQHFIDGTLGLGGHSQVILQATYPNGNLIGIDRDQSAIDLAKNNLSEFGERVHFIHDDFRNIDKILEKLHIRDVHGIILDLGVSSLQLDTPQRGFSFRNEGPLDMRMDQFSHISAYDLINSLSEKEIASIIKNFGEERHCHRIARFVIQERNKKPIETTSELVDIIQKAMPFHNRHEKIHPATRTFQAL